MPSVLITIRPCSLPHILRNQTIALSCVAVLLRGQPIHPCFKTVVG